MCNKQLTTLKVLCKGLCSPPICVKSPHSQVPRSFGFLTQILSLRSRTRRQRQHHKFCIVNEQKQKLCTSLTRFLYFCTFLSRSRQICELINYLLLVLVDYWLFTIHYSWLWKPKYTLFIFYFNPVIHYSFFILIPLFIIYVLFNPVSHYSLFSFHRRISQVLQRTWTHRREFKFSSLALTPL